MATPAMKENLCMDRTVFSEDAFKALKTVLKKPYFKVKYFAYGYDEDKHEILFFFPIESLFAMNYAKYHFLIEVRSAWKKAGYRIINEVELPKYEYRRIGFASLCFRLKRNEYLGP